MRLSNRSLPHPVLGNADDVPAFEFQPTVVPEVTAHEVGLTVDIACSCPTITKLVKDGKAEYALHVECGHTLYRQSFPSAAASWSVSIPAAKVAVAIELCAFVVATRPVKKYAVAGAHPRYDGVTFAVQPGDFLAIRGLDPLPLDPRDPLARIGSIFQVHRATEPGDRPVAAEYLADKIHLTLSQPDADRYALLKGNPALAGLLATAFVLPALVQAVNLMADDPEGKADECAWAEVVRRRMEELGLSYDQPLTAAQEQYGRPITRAFRAAQVPPTEAD